MQLMTLKHIMWIWVFLLLLSGCFQSSAFDDQLHLAAISVNQDCPKMIDEETRLDMVNNFPGKIMQYNYTLVNKEKEEYDSVQFDSIMKSYLIETIKGNSELKIFRDNQVTLIHNYFDRKGFLIDSISIVPDDYQ